MDKERIEEIRKREREATPGLWNRCGTAVMTGMGIGEKRISALSIQMNRKAYPDAEFIANARQDIPDLLDSLEAAQEEIERLQEALAKAEEKACRLVNSSGGIDGQVTIVEKCSICQAVFKNMHRKHTDNCPFKILES